MLPEMTLLTLMGVVLILGGREPRKGIRRYIIIATIALLQSALVVAEMYLMKVPKT